MPSKKNTPQIGDHYVVVGGKHGGRQGVVLKLTSMKARVQFDGEGSSHLVDQSFLSRGFASTPGTVGDRVAIVKGKYAGAEGYVQRFTTEMVYVLLPSGSSRRLNQSSIACISKRSATATRLESYRSVSPPIQTGRRSRARGSSTASPRPRTVSPTPSCEEGDVEVKVRVSRHRHMTSSSGRRVPRAVHVELEYF